MLLSGYCTAVRTSGQLERRRHEDLAFQVLAGNTTLDHVTLARFRVRHEQALAGLLIQSLKSLKLCAAAGMGAPGLVALDGTKVEANAAPAANADLTAQVAEPLSQAAAVDQAEDREHGAA